MGFHTANEKKVFKAYQSRIDKGKLEYRDLISGLKRQNMNICGYGASATSTTLMYQYRMENDFDYLVDDFEAKHHLFSPGMHVPVFPSQKIYARMPDYIVILAWRYYEKIIARHQRFLDAGGHFIIPLPELKII